jgi:hypothetical protein
MSIGDDALAWPAAVSDLTVRAGGQTGVDRAALDYAVSRGLDYAGWCPKGGWAEDFDRPPGVLTLFPGLVETPSADPAQRTAWNVRDSHATLLLVKSSLLTPSPGTHYTRQCAELIFLRPCLTVDLVSPPDPDAVRGWLRWLAQFAGPGSFVLNVAGPRESQAPGIHDAAFRFLTELLG